MTIILVIRDAGFWVFQPSTLIMLMPHDKLGYKCGLSVTDEILSSDWQTNTKKESATPDGKIMYYTVVTVKLIHQKGLPRRRM